MIQIYPKIFLLKGFCSSYYIDDKAKVLIDAGSDFNKPVDFLILTHLHPDHVFYAKKIQEKTGCKIFIGKNDEDLKPLLDNFPSWQGKKIKEFKIDKVLENGEEISTGEYNLNVLATPGHTKGSISLYEKKHKLLFSGDTMFNNGLIGRTDLFNSKEELMGISLKLLRKLEVKRLFPGHDY